MVRFAVDTRGARTDRGAATGAAGSYTAGSGIAIAGNTISAPGVSVLRGEKLNVCDPNWGADNTGTTDNATVLSNAYNAMVAAGGGEMFFPPGKFKSSIWPNFQALSVTGGAGGFPYAMRGAGRSLTVLQSTATSLANSLTVSAPNFVTTKAPVGCPAWGGFTIDGAGTSGGAVGLHWSDVNDIKLDDITIQNFPSGDGIYWHNQLGWCEEIDIGTMLIENCANAMHFAIGANAYPSFDYWKVHRLCLELQPGQNGIVSDASLNGTYPNYTRYGTRWSMTGNVVAQAGNTGKLFWLKGNDIWQDTVWDVNVEADGTGTAHTSLQMDGASSFIGGTGTFITNALNTANLTQGNWQFTVAGNIVVLGIGGTQTSPLLTSGPLKRWLFARPSGYVSSVTNGVSFQNPLSQDVMVTIPITFTGAGTVTFNAGTTSGVPAGTVTAAAGSAGMTIPITFLHPSGWYGRVDVTNATIGTPIPLFA